MSQGNLRRCCCAKSGSHSRHNLEGDVGAAEGFHFFPCTAEDQRIAALQPDDTQPGVGERYHKKVDFFLLNVLLAAALANVMNLRGCRDELQYLWRNQVVVEHSLCSIQYAQSFQRNH